MLAGPTRSSCCGPPSASPSSRSSPSPRPSGGSRSRSKPASPGRAGTRHRWRSRGSWSTSSPATIRCGRRSTQPWRPVTVAAVLAGAVLAAGWETARRASVWRAGTRHRRRQRDRLHSPTWAARRDLTGLLGPATARADGEPPADGRLLVGAVAGRDVLVPNRTSVMVDRPDPDREVDPAGRPQPAAVGRPGGGDVGQT